MDDDDNKLEQTNSATKPKWIPPAAGMDRVKGSQNKITKTLKQAILETFDRVGGVEYLVKVAGSDPKTYIPLLAQVMPHQIQAEVSASGSILFKTVYEGEPEALPSPMAKKVECADADLALKSRQTDLQERSQRDDIDARRAEQNLRLRKTEDGGEKVVSAMDFRWSLSRASRPFSSPRSKNGPRA